MPFQIKALDPAPFTPLFALSDTELEAHNAVRMVVDESPGTPCRVSLEDARVGEQVILLNYQHQPRFTPYQASHAIFVREGASKAEPAESEVPAAIFSRLISIRGFDDRHHMIEATTA